MIKHLFEKNFRQQMNQMPMSKENQSLGDNRAEQIVDESPPRERGRKRD